MFITYTAHSVQFQYGAKGWQYDFNEIAKLGILRKRKSHIIENIISAIGCALVYYYLFFTDWDYAYAVVPLLLCFAVLLYFLFLRRSEFAYYIMVQDTNQKQTRIRIKAGDRHIIRRELEHYENIDFKRTL